MTESTVVYVRPNQLDAGAVPVNTTVATHDRTSDGAEMQDVYIGGGDSLPLPTGAATSANQSLELAQLQALNVTSSVIFDTIKISYADATKQVITKIEWFLGVTLVKTHTPTFAATTDTWVRT